MNAIAEIKPDEIFTFMGDIPAEEYDLRAKLRSYRNAANGMVSQTNSETARQLAWMVIEWATPNLYAPASLEWLESLNKLSKRLMVTALQVEVMDLSIMGGLDD